MVLSLCSGFGFTKNETVWAADNAVTAGESVSAASGSATVTPTTGPSATVTPTPEPEEPETPTVTPTVKPEEPTVKPEEPTVKPEEPTVKPEEPTVKPEEPTVKPEEPTVKPEAPTEKPTTAPSRPSVPSVPDIDMPSIQPGSKPSTDKDSAKDDSTKPGTTEPEKEKNPDIITEKDVYTKEEQEKLAEFKLPQVAEEVKEKTEALVQKILKVFNKVSEEVQKKMEKNITLGKAPVTEHSLATVLNNNAFDLMSKSLSVREQKRIEAGEKLNMYMEVKDATQTVSKQEKILVEKMVKDISTILNEGKTSNAERKTELGMYLDLNLMKQIGNDKAKKVVNPKGKIDVSIQLPKNLLNKDAKVQRVYQIICVQDGKSVLLDAEFNVKTNALSFKTDKFATFALIYTDVPVEKKSGK